MAPVLAWLGKYQRPIALGLCAVVGLDLAIDELNLGDAVTSGLLILAAALGVPQPRALAEAIAARAADARNPFPPLAQPPRPGEPQHTMPAEREISGFAHSDDFRP